MKLNTNGLLTCAIINQGQCLQTPLRLLCTLTCFFVLTGCGTNPTSPQKQSASPNPKESATRAEANAIAEALPSPPNILLISLDTVCADHLGCYGYEQATTPHLDKLAAESVRFEQCRSQATWTLPAHMSLFTSLLPSHHGVDNLNRVLPRRVLLLAEILQQANYQTAALVNNGQMKAHWGFNSGFDLWQEFEVDTPEGSARHITEEAVNWLQHASKDKPYFLFLHYYDAHDPYDASERFREQFKVKLTPQQCRELCFAHRTPDQPELSKDVLSQVVAAYDAGLAELDHELGRLLATVDPETLIVIFSDHGEAFEQHGWMLHGATLYEEEVRVPLIMRLPQSAHAGLTLKDSTMLLDVAPTLLSFANLPSPQQFQGTDLRPVIAGQNLPPRLIGAESKAVLEGRFSRSAVLENYKAIWSLEDGSYQLFQLPDEQNDIAHDEPKLATVLKNHLIKWVNEESFWMVHATDNISANMTVKLSSGSFGLFLPLGFDPERDSLEISPEGDQITWHVSTVKDGRKKSLLLEPSDPQTTLRFSASFDPQTEKAAVYTGPQSEPAETLPVDLTQALAASPPVEGATFQAFQQGLHIMRYKADQARASGGEFAPLDQETIRQLRSLGYLK